MSQFDEILASARAIQVEKPGIPPAELRDRLRGIYVFDSYGARLNHAVAVWTARAKTPVAAFVALIIAPLAAAWGSAFGPRKDVVEKWIDAAIVQVEASPADLSAPPGRGGI